MKNMGIGMIVYRLMYEKNLVPEALHRSEIWCMQGTKRQKLSVLEIKCLTNVKDVLGLE